MGALKARELPKPAVELEPMPEDKSAEVDVVAEKADEAQPMQPLGADKAAA